MTIAGVTAGGEADRAGLQVGDTILEINGKPTGQEVSQELARLNQGDTITVKLRGRRGAERALQWKVGAREEISYELKDMEDVTAEQRARRGAWLKGEDELPPGLPAN
jgi:predicted metalloprotease with PDZ domain